jgi:predicted Zn-dependent protease
MRAAGHILESVSKPVAGGRERGRPAGRGAPPTYTRFWREHPVGLFADRTRQRVLKALLLTAVLVLSRPAVSAAQTTDALGARAAEAAAAMQAGKFQEAATIYAELAAARPADAGLLMNLGMARYMAGHPAEALPPLQKAVRLRPALAPASLFLGAAFLDLGRAREAVLPLERAVTAMPQNADAREMLARAYLQRSQFTKASVQYQMLTTMQPVNPKAWYGLAGTYEGIAEEALEALQRQSPDSPLIELVVADVAVTQEKFAAALAIYRRALDGAAPVGGLHEAVAELYERAGKPEWAAAESRKVRRRSSAECAAHHAECHFLAGRFRESLAAARQSPAAVDRYWVIRSANRLATEAVARLEKLPSSVELHLIRAELAQSRGRHTEAVTEVRGALALSPGNLTIETALAEALLHAHNLDEALPLLERLNREHPADGHLLFMYGDALVQSQQLEGAIPILERAVKADGALLSARASLGRAYVQARRYEEALSHLEAAAGADEDGDVHYQLARAYQALERPVEAQKAMTEYQKRRERATPAPSGDTADKPLTPPK